MYPPDSPVELARESVDRAPSRQSIRRPDLETREPASFETRLSRAVEAARGAILEEQHDDGHWCAELEGDTILESEYILCLHFLGRTDEERVEKLARYLRQKQLPDGGWAPYPGGPTDVSASVKAYLVLKLMGDDPDAPHLQRAREAILDAGGIEATELIKRKLSKG